jgi:hypothetical protein
MTDIIADRCASNNPAEKELKAYFNATDNKNMHRRIICMRHDLSNAALVIKKLDVLRRKKNNQSGPHIVEVASFFGKIITIF